MRDLTLQERRATGSGFRGRGGNNIAGKRTARFSPMRSAPRRRRFSSETSPRRSLPRRPLSRCASQPHRHSAIDDLSMTMPLPDRTVPSYVAFTSRPRRKCPDLATYDIGRTTNAPLAQANGLSERGLYLGHDVGNIARVATTARPLAYFDILLACAFAFAFGAGWGGPADDELAEPAGGCPREPSKRPATGHSASLRLCSRR